MDRLGRVSWTWFAGMDAADVGVTIDAWQSDGLGAVV